MEGSESEAIFDSLNINPRKFINETLNSVDDLLDDAFTYYSQEASTLLKINATDRSQDLTKVSEYAISSYFILSLKMRGVNYIRNKVQSALDMRLNAWEAYCLQHCFQVPEGFSLRPTNDGLCVDSLINLDSLSDPDQEAQLASLREKLNAVGKESAELNREIQTLERQSASSTRSAEFLKDALKLYDEDSVRDMFEELVKIGTELRTKMDQMQNKRMRDIDRDKKENIYNLSEDLLAMKRSKGLHNVNLEELHLFISELKHT
ncbi:hypothetical protein ACFE04_000157 [Oxalis oulophora]